MVSLPLNPLLYMAAKTAADRKIRDSARKKYVEDSVAACEDEKMVGILLTIISLNFNKADQDDVKEAGDAAEEMRLIVEAQEMHAGVNWKLWRANLQGIFGMEIGEKLANHQVEVGMTNAMLSAAYGVVPEDGMYRNRENGRTVFVYGSGEDASYFELSEDGIVMVAIARGGWVIPDCVYDFPGFTV